MSLNRIQIVCLALLSLTFYMNFYKLEYIQLLKENNYSDNQVIPYKIYPWQYIGTPSFSPPEWLSHHLISSLVHVMIVTLWNIQDRNINYFVLVSHINFWLVIIPNMTTLGSLHWLAALIINSSVFASTSMLLMFHYINNNKLKYMLVLTSPVIFETVLWLMNAR